jgi:hypothetical protein
MANPNNKVDQWLMLWQKLHAIRLQPLPTEEEIDYLMSVLPKRLPDENITDWINRHQNPTNAVVTPFRKRRIIPISRLQLMAASDGIEQYPLPEKPLVTPDQSFRYSLISTDQGLEITLTALGFAIEDYAEHYIGIATSDSVDNLIAIIYLDNDGRGNAIIDDTASNRKVLCVNPMFFLIEPDYD